VRFYVNRGDFQKLTQERLQDARALLKKRRYSGAYYLFGYVVECALKACVAKQTKKYDFPPERKSIENIYTHDFEKLVGAAELKVKLDRDFKSNKDLERNWAVVKDWKETSRYEEHDEKKVKDFFEAITDEKHGVLKWLKRHW